MQQILLSLIVMFSVFSGADKSEENVLSLKSNNLKGRVKYTSQRTTPSILLDSDWNTIVDTSLTEYQSVHNKYFNKRGFVESYKDFDKDSTLITYTIFNYSESDRFNGFDEFNKDGEKKSTMRVITNSGSSMVLECYSSKTNDLLYEQTMLFENGLCVQKDVNYIGLSMSQSSVFKLNKAGDIYKTISETDFDGESNKVILFVEFLEFDENGNWTKQIMYTKEDKGSCFVIEREIVYYQ